VAFLENNKKFILFVGFRELYFKRWHFRIFHFKVWPLCQKSRMTNFQKQKFLSLSLGFNSNLNPQQTNKKNIPITIGITLPIPYKQKSPFLGKE
jgi:hypothetical protein